MPASEQPDCRAGLRVLLVEDENLVALLLEDMLAELGHTVVGPVARLDKALEMAQAGRVRRRYSRRQYQRRGGLSDRRCARCSRHPFRLFNRLRQEEPARTV